MKKLTVALLKQLAGDLEVPATASSDEIRQLIEGKLSELGHDSRNVQVLVQDTGSGTHLGLQDGHRVFLEVEPVSTEDVPSHGPGIEDRSGSVYAEGTDLETLQVALKERPMT